MTKFTKLIAAVALLWLVAAQATPLMAQQNYDFQVGQLYYKITDATKRKVAVVGGNNEPTGAITIPATVVNGGNTYSVTSIGERAFSSCTKLAAINIPNSVTSIGEWAFAGCIGLTAINIPNGVTSIGWGAFEDCKGLTSINIPNGITKIENSTFLGCQRLTSINIPNSVMSIGRYAFANCSRLYSINIPSRITKIENGTFSGCSRLTAINLPSALDSSGSKEFNSYDKGVFENCTRLTSINIPNGVRLVGKNTFKGCNELTYINIPNSVTCIGKSAFSGCSGLTSINIPSGITKIEDGTFLGCKGLTSINITNSVTIIGMIAFADCSRLFSINIPSGITKIENGTFSFCEGLNSIDIPNGVTSIGERAFYGCKGLTSIKIPSGITKIEKGTFSGSKGLTSINIPSGVTSIGNSAFYDCSGLTSIKLPSALDSIGSKEFDSYDKGVFENCTGLTSINIPNSVTIIGNKAFRNCRGLTSVAVSWQTPLAINNSVFEGVTLNNVKLIVPRGKKAVYRAAEVWEEFNPIVEDADYTITYSQPANGTLKVKNGTQEITSGSTVKGGTILTIEATPDPHYKLDSILINGKRSDKLNITVEENTHIEAFFGKEKYTVKYNNPYGGKLYVIKGTDIVTSGEGVEYGTELTVKTAPDAGFKLKSLTLNGQTIPDNYKFAISEPVTIEVVFTSVETGLDETSAAGTVVYPNPVVDILRIATDTPIRTIRVFDIYGKEVARAADTDRIDMSHLPAGVYTVRADGKTARVVKK